MADNDLAIAITARDGATPVVSRVSNLVGTFGKRVKTASEAFEKALQPGRDMSRRLRSVGASAVHTALDVGRLEAPLAAIGGAVTISGIAALASEWAKLGFETTQAAANIGVSASQLQGLQVAANAAGVSSATLTGGLAQFGQTLNDAVYGRNAMALGLLMRLGIHLHRNAAGAVDAAAAMDDLADAIQRQKNPQTQVMLARQFGVENLLPMLRGGRAAMEKYRAEARSLGATKTPELIAEENELFYSFQKFELALKGVSNVMEATYLPLLNKTLDLTTAMISHAETLTATIAGIGTTFLSVFSVLKGAGWIAKLLGLGAVDIPAAPIAAAAAGAVGVYDVFRGVDQRNAATKRTIGERGNNPLDLRSWGNMPVAGGFAQFPTAEAGLTAGARNLLAYQDKHHLDTITGIVSRWAPAADGNNVPAYISQVSGLTGYGPNQKLNLHDPVVLEAIIKAMITHEQGRNPYADSGLAQAVTTAERTRAPLFAGNSTSATPEAKAVQVHVHITAPPGTKAAVTDEKGNLVPAKIQYSMAHFDLP